MEKKVQKWTIEQFKNHVISEAMKILDAGEPLDIKMNKMDTNATSDGAKVKSNAKGGFDTKESSPKAGAENIEKIIDTIKVEMNQTPSEGGSDEKIASAVGVEAGSKGKNGQLKPDFESKDKQPSKEASAPFEEKGETDMNKMDQEGEDGAKTFVQPGEKSSTGQAKPKFSEEAKNEKDKIEKMADVIQLPESFKNKKEMLDFINEQAKKIAKLI